MWQIRVEWDREDLARSIEIANEKMTSGVPGSQVVKGKGDVFMVSVDDITWLIGALQSVQRHIDRDEAKANRSGEIL